MALIKSLFMCNFCYRSVSHFGKLCTLYIVFFSFQCDADVLRVMNYSILSPITNLLHLKRLETTYQSG